MKKIRVYVATNKVGSESYDEFEIEDDATEEEIDKEVEDYIWNMIDSYWEEVK